MEKKKHKTKVTKTKPKVGEHGKSEKIDVKPIVVKTKGDPKQEGNPLNRIKTNLDVMTDIVKRELPEGFKTADKVTEKDDLEFENKKLRDMLTMWNFKLKFNGVWYYFLVDPMNQTLEMFDKDPMSNE